ncbi:hypothetical protein B484DRAFT_402061 [Ochromonadaceae sp. CCMP2298]|nr:hypothetical protein B484DRAFT_402061 [Ochromonadaceae sp. CCMP2298]
MNTGAFCIEKQYAEHFELKPSAFAMAMSQASTGAWVRVSEAEASRHFPEGFAGTTAEEFEFTGEPRWMVRDAGKLLCGLIDDFEAHKAGASSPASRAGFGAANTSAHLQGLTDRPEWFDAVMHVEAYGRELLGHTRPSLKAAGDLSAERPAGDLAVQYRAKLVKMQDNISQTGPLDRVLLAGPRGVGKSVALSQAVLHARQNGWIVLFVPLGWRQVQAGTYVEPSLHTLPGSEAQAFDNHEMSVEVLRGFWRAHFEQLRAIPIRDADTLLAKYAPYLADFKEALQRTLSVESGSSKLSFSQLRALVDGEDNFPELDLLDADVLADLDFLKFQPKTLEDLVILGVALREISGSLFMDLVGELRELESSKVLFAVDQFNTWEVPSAFSYRGRKLMGKELCVPAALNFLSFRKDESAEYSLRNGFCIAATSEHYSEGKTVNYADQRKSIPLTVTVPAYSAAEFLSAGAYYTTRNVLPREMELPDFLALRMFTGSNPRLLRLQSLSFLMPRVMHFLQQREELATGVAAENARLGGGGYDDEEGGGRGQGGSYRDRNDGRGRDDGGRGRDRDDGGRGRDRDDGGRGRDDDTLSGIMDDIAGPTRGAGPGAPRGSYKN